MRFIFALSSSFSCRPSLCTFLRTSNSIILLIQLLQIRYHGCSYWRWVVVLDPSRSWPEWFVYVSSVWSSGLTRAWRSCVDEPKQGAVAVSQA